MWLGKMKKASISDATSEAMTTLGMIAKNFPSTPVIISSSGRNAATVVMVELTTGQKTSAEPTIAACRRGLPSSMCR